VAEQIREGAAGGSEREANRKKRQKELDAVSRIIESLPEEFTLKDVTSKLPAGLPKYEQWIHGVKRMAPNLHPRKPNYVLKTILGLGLVVSRKEKGKWVFTKK